MAKREVRLGFQNNHYPADSRRKRGKLFMEHEVTRKQFYEDKIHEMAAQAAQILDEGNSLELARSRSGIKMFSVRRRHEVLGGNGKDGGRHE